MAILGSGCFSRVHLRVTLATFLPAGQAELVFIEMFWPLVLRYLPEPSSCSSSVANLFLLALFLPPHEGPTSLRAPSASMLLLVPRRPSTLT